MQRKQALRTLSGKITTGTLVFANLSGQKKRSSHYR